MGLVFQTQSFSYWSSIPISTMESYASGIRYKNIPTALHKYTNPTLNCGKKSVFSQKHLQGKTLIPIRLLVSVVIFKATSLLRKSLLRKHRLRFLETLLTKCLGGKIYSTQHLTIVPRFFYFLSCRVIVLHGIPLISYTHFS